jgi:hypothetical protein
MPGVRTGHARAVNGDEELDNETAAVLDQSAQLVDESRRLLRRVDRLLARRRPTDEESERPRPATG